jgi:hypothetical protein
MATAWQPDDEREATHVTLSPEALAVLERAKRLRTSERDCLVFPGLGGRQLSD